MNRRSFVGRLVGLAMGVVAPLYGVRLEEPLFDYVTAFRRAGPIGWYCLLRGDYDRRVYADADVTLTIVEPRRQAVLSFE